MSTQIKGLLNEEEFGKKAEEIKAKYGLTDEDRQTIRIKFMNKDFLITMFNKSSTLTVEHVLEGINFGDYITNKYYRGERRLFIFLGSELVSGIPATVAHIGLTKYGLDGKPTTNLRRFILDGKQIAKSFYDKHKDEEVKPHASEWDYRWVEPKKEDKPKQEESGIASKMNSLKNRFLK